MRHTGHSEKNSFKTALCDSLFIAAIYQFICDFSGKRGKLFYNLFASWLNKYVGFRFRNGQFSFVCALTCDVWRILLIWFPDFNSISIYHPNCFCSTSKTKHWWDVLDDLFFAVLVELKVKEIYLPYVKDGLISLSVMIACRFRNSCCQAGFEPSRDRLAGPWKSRLLDTLEKCVQFAWSSNCNCYCIIVISNMY